MLLIKNGTVITADAEWRILENTDVLIEDDRIAAIGRNLEARTPGGNGDAGERRTGEARDEIVDATGCLVIPGLIQTHVHLCQTLFRGQADDLELLDWLKLRIWPLEAAHDEESIYLSALLGTAELLKSGTTTIVDMETVNHTDAAFRAMCESGIRAFAGKVMMDHGEGLPPGFKETTDESIEESVGLLEKWHMADNGRLRYAFAPRFAVSCSDGLLREVGRLARHYGVLVHTHASENRSEVKLVEEERGLSNIRYLKSVGLTSDNLVLAHCIWIDDEEMEILRAGSVKVVHCPSSNLKLGSGLARVPEMMDKGISVTLGSDGAPCNNNLDAFGEMRKAALIHKPGRGPRVMPADTVFRMVTIDAARAVGLENEIGSIEVGKKADLVVVDLNKPHAWPPSDNPVAALVYSALPSDVSVTIVDGRTLVSHGRLLSFSEEKLLEDSIRAFRRVVDRAGLKESLK